jgi:hypothetical protein
MRAAVYSKSVLSIERAATISAAKRSVARVCPHVVVQIVLACKCAATAFELANELFVLVELLHSVTTQVAFVARFAERKLSA